MTRAGPGPATAEAAPVARGRSLGRVPAKAADHPSTMIGQPVESEAQAQARALPAVQAVYEAARASPRRGVLAEGNHRMLCDALSAVGVQLGGYDHAIAIWLAWFEPATVAVVAGWVTRAGARP